ncbi:MAG: choice-of-anchor D domain-containing protein [Acidobacteria bacterium]|nr:choice-of-anchor D domain-containing protein [Acidobacteriota bacterium]
MTDAIRRFARALVIVLVSSSSVAAQAPLAPSITRVNPDNAAIGDEIRIRGTNLVDVTSVQFTGGSRARFFAENPTRIRVTVPVGARTGPITVVTKGGRATSPDVTIRERPTSGPNPEPSPTGPVVLGFDPASAAPGEQIVISGRNFKDVTGVEFNGRQAARFRVLSEAEIRATVPAGATSGAVTVVTRSGRASGRALLKVTAPPSAGAPTIGSVNPTAGSVGDRIDVTGTGFADVRKVQFNGVDARFTVRSLTAIRAFVPQGATTGPIRVETGAGQARSREAFTVRVPIPAPVIAGVTPSRGAPGDVVRIDGSGFVDVQRVEVGGIAAAHQVISETRIRMTLPLNARTGPVVVIARSGRGTSSGDFTVVPKAVPPAIGRLNPDRGRIGDLVTIVGTGFVDVRRVEFNGVNARFSVLSDTRIRATVPFGATTGRVSVVTAGGRADGAPGFTIQRPPDARLQFAARTASVRASDRRIDVAVTREGDASVAVSVEYLARDRGAVAGRDYRLRAGRLSFAAGERRKVIPVEILEGRIGPAYRDFELLLRNPRSGALLGNPSSTVVTIVDDLTSGAVLDVRESSLDFGQVRIGQATRRTVTVRNSGRGVLAFDVDTLGAGEGFVLVERPTRARLAAGETATFALEFRARWRVGRFNGTLVVRSNAGDRSIALRAEALGVLPAVPSLLTTAVDFGAVRQGDRATWPVTIRNTGLGRLRILDARIDSGSSAGFYIATRPSRMDLGPWETATLLVGFAPSGFGDGVVYGRLRVETSGGVVTTYLQADRRAEPFLVLEPRSIDFGEVEPNDEAMRDLVVANDGDAPLRARVRLRSGEGTFFIEGSRDLTVEPRGSRTISVGFAPGSSGGIEYTGSIEVRSEGGDALVPLTGSVRVVQPPSGRPFVAIEGPATGEVLTSGDAATVRFSAFSERGLDGFEVTYSLDGGLTYPYRIGEAGGDVRAIIWNVPEALQTSRARVKVTARDLDGNVEEAVSDLISVRPLSPLLRVDIGIDPMPGGQITPPTRLGYRIRRVAPDEDTAPDIWDPNAIDTVDPGRSQAKGASLVAYDVYRVQSYGDGDLPTADEVAGNPENLIATVPSEDGVASDVLSTFGPAVSMYTIVSRFDDGQRSRPSSPVVVRLPAIVDPRFENAELTMAADGSAISEEGAIVIVDGREEFRVRLDRRSRILYVQDIDRSINGTATLGSLLRPGRTVSLVVRNPDAGESAPVSLAVP